MNVNYILSLILSIPGLFLALTFHEFAHGYAAYLMGDNTARYSGRLSMNPLHHDRLDNCINKWLEENDVEVVDIKYSTCGGVNSRDGVSWVPSAMLIYKEK